MSTASLIVRNQQGEILYDTSKATYGLIKSGPVEYAGRWSKYNSIFTDLVYSFTVTNAISPIVFVVGTCGQPYQSKEGDNTVFYFAGPVAGLQVYCFDIMRPIFSGPALKTRDSSANFTFNSLQRPLAVRGVSTPPVPSGPWAPLPSSQVPTDPVSGFSGGSSFLAQEEYIDRGNPSLSVAGFRCYYYDFVADPTRTKTFAAYIPWGRGCFSLGNVNTGSSVFYVGSLAEGCGGVGSGLIRHTFWTAPETSYEGVSNQFRPGIYSLNVSPRPTSLYIDTAEYPYPFNPQL